MYIQTFYSHTEFSTFSINLSKSLSLTVHLLVHHYERLRSKSESKPPAFIITVDWQQIIEFDERSRFTEYHIKDIYKSPNPLLRAQTFPSIAMTSDPRAWISGDESAAAMLSRLQASRPALLVPPLHRVPLRTGNVVEIAGPSHSGKSQVLLEV